MKKAFAYIVTAVILTVAVVMFLNYESNITEPISTCEYTPVIETEQPTPQVTRIIEWTSAPTETPFLKREANEYLFLVNWENPLAEDYEPEHLVRMKSILGNLVSYKNSSIKLDETACQAAFEMFTAAKNDGIKNFLIASGYRSINSQRDIEKDRLRQNPNYFSDPYNSPVKAMPHNISEYSTGLAIDILSTKHRSSDDTYKDTKQAQWLKENAHKYGFILRYPEDKQSITGVISEPWHYRYVGVEAATEMYELGLCLEEYVMGN